jgi:5-methyltetrahydrofolate--homocysteine methyltransferase
MSNPSATVKLNTKELAPPFWGVRCIEFVPLASLLPYINRTALFKFQWGFKPKGKQPDEYRVWAKKEVEPILQRLVLQDKQQQIIQPKAVYGYFPCQSDGNEIIIYDDPKQRNILCRFSFPRQKKSERKLCVADFFHPVASEQVDVIAMQLVTIGQHAADFARDLFQRDVYQDYLYWHGLNAEAAEAMAEYVHKRIRLELGFNKDEPRDMQDLFKQKYRGSRYSFGYPACPDLEQQAQLLALLDADRIGVTLGDEFQLWPEESTSAIVVLHPQAKYFTI